MTRVCRVVPDVTALERSFDYLVPDELGARLRVGTIVRVPLHGRRVRAWVVDDDVVSETSAGKLLAVQAVVSAGPPREVVALSAWVAHTWCGPRVAVLRSASPPNNVRGDAGAAATKAAAVPEPVTDAERNADGVALDATLSAAAVVQWPPLVDRRRLVERLIAPVGSTIVAVADGTRAAALADSLARRGYRALLLHSDEPPAVRTRAWADARAGAAVVIGGRVVAFAPVPDLASVIVVDDADEALQEERVPTWHARDVLAERATRCGAHFTVVSAAPTTDAVVRFGVPIAPPADVQRAGWPRVEVVDRREEPPGAGLYSPALAGALHAAHTASGGAAGAALCVLNRRGRARLLACDACGSLTRWDRAGAPVWSAGDDVAMAGAPAARPTVCPHCGSTRLRTLRVGVTRVREELSALLGGLDVGEVDAATAEIPDSPVLVGTESVLHRPEVRRRRPFLVAFLDFDAELMAPRYRAGEQALWLLVRAAHLLMQRRRDETRVLVQTRQPDHEVIVAATEARPEFVVEGEMARRRALSLPPFAALAELSGERDAVGAALDGLRALEHQAAGVVALGPLGGTTGARGLVRAPAAESLAAALAAVLPAARAQGRIRVAVDPPRV